MKFRVTLKDPDGVYKGTLDAARMSICEVIGVPSRAAAEELSEKRAEQLREAIGPWVECGGYVTIEFDTDAKTARVVPLEEDND